jgi:hypothetical protein
VFGNCPIWSFGRTTTLCALTDWVGQLGGVGSVSMGLAQKLFASRPWFSLVPDTNHTALTAGFGTSGTPTYVTAARAADGSTVIAYLPTSTTITLNMASVSGPQALAWWYEPSSGKVTALGSFAPSGTRSFTPPTGGTDWVFVLDSSGRAFGPPGTAPLAVPAIGVGTALALAVLLGAIGLARMRRGRGP